jgi:putative ABC transport system substrate-binding protein
MRRREFITLGGGAAAWPLLVHAQQPERMRRIGMILPAAAADKEFQSWVGAFLQAMAQLNWIIGRNIRVDIHWATADATNIPKHAAELAALVTRAVVQATLSKECITVAFDRVTCCADSISSSLARLWKSSAKSISWNRPGLFNARPSASRKHKAAFSRK